MTGLRCGLTLPLILSHVTTTGLTVAGESG